MPNNNHQLRRCATHDLSAADRARMAALENEFREVSRIHEADLSLTINVAFIHVTDGDEGRVTADQRRRQIEVMNKAFEPIGIDFAYEEDQTIEKDDAAFFRMGHGSLRERQCKSQNQTLDPNTGLHFYTARPGGGLLGWATFPVDLEGDPEMDGVVLLDGTLPGGSTDRYNLGLTGVHEIAHWLGLYHTFQDGCLGLGDEVDDTPAHAAPNYDKPSDGDQPHNLCDSEPAGSLCPIHNYMNYVDDDWMWEFTRGQKDRIWAQIGMFRAGLLATVPGAKQAMESGARVAW